MVYISIYAKFKKLNCAFVRMYTQSVTNFVCKAKLFKQFFFFRKIILKDEINS